MKALETPEEKRARRLAKKEAKDRKYREKMGWDQEYMGYTNADNPYGDEKLLVPFIWHKKLENDGLDHLTAKKKKALIKRKQESNKLELEKVKRQRLEREKERQERDAEMEIMQREKEADHFKAWEDQEDKFHLEQAKLRSRIRIKDGRAKPIDLLAKYATSAEEGAEDLSGLEMHEPYTYLNGLTMSDLENLLEDIKVYIELEQGKNVDFWRDMTVITQDELETLKKIEERGRNPRERRREGINEAVMGDVQTMFKGKTYNQLIKIQKGITAKLKKDVDVGYWESVLSLQKAYLARARLRERHQELLKVKLMKLKEEQLSGKKKEADDDYDDDDDEDDDDEVERPIKLPKPVDCEEDRPGPSGLSGSKKDDNEAAAPVDDNGEVDLDAQCTREYRDGGYSPRLIEESRLPLGVVVVDANEDRITIEGKRRLLMRTGDADTGQEDAFVRRAKEGMDREEAVFAVQADISNQVILWADKYRPRKPRFFNRVHTGFEWNKYNQTHYDFENPPPKIVQGYKFNIFYPDLIDHTKTPEYKLTSDASSPDFVTLRFSAGPPYEDIAFKIVNREWEYSHKHGFRCQFINSIFQLWFHFKRYRYRR